MDATSNFYKPFCPKKLLILLAFIFTFAFLPCLFQSVAYAEEVHETSLSAENVTEESAQGRLRTTEELSNLFQGGYGYFSIVDRSYTPFNTKKSEASETLRLRNSSSLPEKVDLREGNTVTSVKHQNRTGTCWAWAANAVSETAIAKSLGKAAETLSAFQTAWFAYERVSADKSQLKGTEVSQSGEGSIASYENETDKDQRVTRFNVGGNTTTATSEFMQGIGVTRETDIPFPSYILNGGNIKSDDILNTSQRRHSISRLSKSNYLGSLINTNGSGEFESTNETVLSNMKTELSKGNALLISFWAGPNRDTEPSRDTYYNSTNNCWYNVMPNSTILQANHAVCVVGYDDTYSKTNFNSSYQPEKDGAFIVKNSWGTDWGDAGYFYLSYYDQTISSADFFEFDTTNYTGSVIDADTEVIDQYDYLQLDFMNSETGYKWYSNIFSATYNQRLHNIGTYYAGSNATLKYKVYKLKTDATSPSDVAGSLDEPVAQGTFENDYEGYVSIKLDTPVTINKGEKYAIWFSQKKTDGDYYAPYGAQYGWKAKYFINGLGIEGKSVVNEGESFKYEATDSTSGKWQTLTSSHAGNDSLIVSDNYCVKGYSTAFLANYTVKFNPNGGSNVSSQTVKEGNKATKPSNPTRQGYTFAGWYSDKALTKVYDFSATVNGNLTLYAKWDTAKCTVTFNTNGGTKINLQTVNYGKTAYKPANPTKSGYVFDGWYVDSSFRTAYNFNTAVKTNITLYSKWIKKVTMYRLYNKWTGEHFYTSSSDEKSKLVKSGWSYEGPGWNAPTKSNTPVYRLYNKYVSGGDHHYTTNKSEVETLKKAGWSYEGIGWYSDDNKAVPLYRLYNRFAVTGTHHYTTSKTELNNLVNLKWRSEGVAWYGA